METYSILTNNPYIRIEVERLLYVLLRAKYHTQAICEILSYHREIIPAGLWKNSWHELFKPWTQFKKHARQQMDFARMWALRLLWQEWAVIQTSFWDHQAENKLWALIFGTTWKIKETLFIICYYLSAPSGETNHSKLNSTLKILLYTSTCMYLECTEFCKHQTCRALYSNQRRLSVSSLIFKPNKSNKT